MLQLGKIYASIGAIAVFAEALDESPDSFLSRHANGDWGELNDDDRKANEYALRHGLRVLSVYRLSTGVKIWLLTESDRSSTTILLPSEY
jgi:hypothetical protein